MQVADGGNIDYCCHCPPPAPSCPCAAASWAVGRARWSGCRQAAAQAPPASGWTLPQAPPVAPGLKELRRRAAAGARQRLAAAVAPQLSGVQMAARRHWHRRESSPPRGRSGRAAAPLLPLHPAKHIAPLPQAHSSLPAVVLRHGSLWAPEQPLASAAPRVHHSRRPAETGAARERDAADRMSRLSPAWRATKPALGAQNI